MELNVFINVYTNSITHPKNMECEKCVSTLCAFGDKMAYRHVNILGGMLIFSAGESHRRAYVQNTECSAIAMYAHCSLGYPKSIDIRHAFT